MHVMILLVALLLPVAVNAAQPTSFPLGHTDSSFSRNDGSVVGYSGWTPTYDPSEQAQKTSLTSQVPVFIVGLPEGKDPSDLGDTGCPVRTTINDASDVAGLPQVSLTGLGIFYLVSDCDLSSSEVKVLSPMRVAFWSTAAQRIGYTSGQMNGVQVFLVDSLVDATNSQAASLQTASGGSIRVAYSEIHGGIDVQKVDNTTVCYKSWFGGYHRDWTRDGTTSSMHNDIIQINSAGLFTALNCTFDGPFRNSNAPLFSGTPNAIDKVRAWGVLLTGGTHALKIGDKSGSSHTDHVLYESMALADATHTSWNLANAASSPPCTLGNAADYEGSGNTALGGLTSGTDTDSGATWNFSSCNSGSVASEHQTHFTDTISDMDTWVAEIRAAAGAASPSPSVTITGATPLSPEVGTDGVTLTFSVDDFTATTGTPTVSWTGTEPDGPENCTFSPNQCVLASGLFTLEGQRCFTVTAEDTVEGAIASNPFCLTWLDTQPKTLGVQIVPATASGASPLTVASISVDVSGTETCAGGAGQARLDVTNDGTWDETDSFSKPDGNTVNHAFASSCGPFTATGQTCRVGVICDDSGTNGAEKFSSMDVTITGGSLPEVVRFELYNAVTGANTGLVLEDGMVLDRALLGSEFSIVTITDESPCIESYTGDACIDLSLTDPTNGAVARDEGNEPYSTSGDSGWLDSQTCVANVTQGAGTVHDTTVDGDFSLSVTPRSAETSGGVCSGGSAGTTVTRDFCVAEASDFPLTATPAEPEDDEAITLSYTEPGPCNDPVDGVVADCDGDGIFESAVNEASNSVACSALDAAAEPYTLAVRMGAEGNLVTTVDVSVTEATLPVSLPEPPIYRWPGPVVAP